MRKQIWMGALVAGLALVGCGKEDKKDPAGQGGALQGELACKNPIRVSAGERLEGVDSLFDGETGTWRLVSIETYEEARRDDGAKQNVYVHLTLDTPEDVAQTQAEVVGKCYSYLFPQNTVGGMESDEHKEAIAFSRKEREYFGFIKFKITGKSADASHPQVDFHFEFPPASAPETSAGERGGRVGLTQELGSRALADIGAAADSGGEPAPADQTVVTRLPNGDIELVRKMKPVQERANVSRTTTIREVVRALPPTGDAGERRPAVPMTTPNPPRP